jgi:hypothetical protein
VTCRQLAAGNFPFALSKISSLLQIVEITERKGCSSSQCEVRDVVNPFLGILSDCLLVDYALTHPPPPHHIHQLIAAGDNPTFMSANATECIMILTTNHLDNRRHGTTPAGPGLSKALLVWHAWHSRTNISVQCCEPFKKPRSWHFRRLSDNLNTNLMFVAAYVSQNCMLHVRSR